MTSYNTYRPGPNNRSQSCLDCERIHPFASPDLWWIFNEEDPLYGSCLVHNPEDLDQLQLACSAQFPWQSLAEGGYEISNINLVTMSAQELITRAIPLGVDQPSFIHPETGELVIDETSSRSRDEALRVWEARAAASPPRQANCDANCSAINRSECAVNSLECGPCLAGYAEHNGYCYGRLAFDLSNALHDESYENNGIYAPPQGQLDQVITMESAASVHRVEVYLGTTDNDGESDYSWANIPGHVMSLIPAPSHTLSLSAELHNGELIELSPLVVLADSSNQNDHSLTYVYESMTALNNVSHIHLSLSSTSDYGLSLLEVRTFGSID